MKRYFTLFFLMVWGVLTLQAQNNLSPLSFDFENKIERGMQLWGIPGLSISVVKDGKVVYSKGFGEVRKDSKIPVTENSLFGISSVTKNFTASALAILVDEGKLTWDTKIIDVLPNFRLQDPWVTQNATIKDALSHKIGVSRVLGSRLRYMTTSGRDDLVHQLRYFDFDAPFRTSFVYSNVMYIVAGQIIESVTGDSWENFIEKRLFDPLSLDAKLNIAGYLHAADRAFPHQEIEGIMTEITPRSWDNASPAGGISASSLDIAKWMNMQLGETGVYEGQKIISQSQMFEMHKPQNIRPQSLPYNAQNSYGFGWNITDYEGKRVLFHSGRTDGFAVASFMLPELELGVVVMSNAHSNLGEALSYQVLDAYLGKPDRDWVQMYYSNYVTAYNKAQKGRKDIHAKRVSGTQTKLPLEKYVGTYYSNQYGKVEILSGPEGLELKCWNDNLIIADLEFWHHDVFRAIWRDRAMREEFLQFKFNINGELEGLEIEFSLRPELIQVGAYPSTSDRKVLFYKVK